MGWTTSGRWDELPHLTEMITYTLTSNYSYADEFEVGLEQIIEAMSRLRAPPCS